MKSRLFHEDTSAVFDVGSLREHAAKLVSDLSLIRRARDGSKEAAIALKNGFWPFVQEFEWAIDRQVLPRKPLAKKFGEPLTRQTFTAISSAVREMKSEEGSHAAHWREDAECLGVSRLGDQRLPTVQTLIDRSYNENLPQFFAMLAGTEFIAEELARFLVTSKKFTELFSRKRWVWGEVHLAHDHNGPSHFEIDLDLARAYSPTATSEAIKEMVVDTIDLFGKAADEVEQVLLLSA